MQYCCQHDAQRQGQQDSRFCYQLSNLLAMASTLVAMASMSNLPESFTWGMNEDQAQREEALHQFKSGETLKPQSPVALSFSIKECNCLLTTPCY